MEIITSIKRWANKQKAIKALILTGSRAKKQKQNLDFLADYDLSIFSEKPPKYLQKDTWLSSIGNIWVCAHEKIYFQKKVYPTRLVIFEKGVKVDFSFFPLALLKTMIQNKFLPDAYNLGYKVLLDKDYITKNLPKPSFEGFKIKKPNQKAFSILVEEFWFEVYHVAKYLYREDLWSVKFRDNEIKNHFLLPMIQWHESAEHDWNYMTHHLGKQMKLWVNKDTWNSLNTVFAHFDAEDSWIALINTMNLFRNIAKQTSQILGFFYPDILDKNITEFVLKLRKKIL